MSRSKQTAPRADFHLTVDLVNAEEGILRTDATITRVRLRIGIENVGTVAAKSTTINVLVPERYLRWLRWSAANGAELPDVPAPDRTSEQIGDGDERGFVAYLSLQRDHIGRRSPVVLHAVLSVDGRRWVDAP